MPGEDGRDAANTGTLTTARTTPTVVAPPGRGEIHWPHSGGVVVSEEGVKFRSYSHGLPLHLSPESSIDAQKQLGADIIIPLDELPAHRTGRTEPERSVAMTHRWEARSLRRHLEGPLGLREQAIFGVIHGGVDRDLRTPRQSTSRRCHSTASRPAARSARIATRCSTSSSF